MRMDDRRSRPRGSSTIRLPGLPAKGASAGSSGPVDDQLELRGPLDGEICGFGGLEDRVDVRRGAPELIRKVWTVRHDASGVPIHLGLDSTPGDGASRARVK